MKLSNKDKVKELIGRSLNTYNDKIKEKTSKIKSVDNEQDRRLNILANEVDGDTLTKTEEGSVISLDYSKDGLVYIDEIQGNTLVNYCTDGDKEMLLNGDIDLEGEGILTTTEGVDGGKVDVYCEGNTLVNIAKIKTITLNSNSVDYIDREPMIISGKTYTTMYNVKNVVNSLQGTVPSGVHLRIFFTDGTEATVVDKSYVNSKIIKTFTIDPTKTVSHYFFGWIRNFEEGMSVTIDNVMILEGDWTNREIPNYFEGMKSVGELEDNRIELKSQNKNLFDGQSNRVGFSVNSNGEISSSLTLDERIWRYDASQYFIPLIKGEYTLTLERIKNIECADGLLYSAGRIFTNSNEDFGTIFADRIFLIGESEGNVNSNINRTTFKLNEDSVIGIHFKIYDGIFKIQLERNNSSTDFVKSDNNKKQIQLQEPLRGLPNGVKDKFVKMGGKWYIERNCKEVVIQPTDNIVMMTSSNENTITFRDNTLCNDGINLGEIICNNLNMNNDWGLINVPYTCRCTSYGDVIRLFVALPKTSLSSVDVAGFKEWLQNNPNKFVYQLKTPTYEPIEDIELTTYLDTTHISNNSSIPCNMKIKNTGYNVIVKPNTLYTVVLNRRQIVSNMDKTVGVNLAGAVTTVPKDGYVLITTPSNPIDDSLRLNSKIKNIVPMLFEGDKSDYIPKEFNGIKSSFDNNSINIKIRNNNLVDINELKLKANTDSVSRVSELTIIDSNHVRLKALETHKGYVYWSSSEFPNILKPNTQYILSCNITKTNPNSKPSITLFFSRIYDVSTRLIKSGSIMFTTPSNVTNVRPYLLFYSSLDNVEITQGDIVDFENIKISEVNSNFISPTSNEITLQLNEPLRGISSYKDKLILKDGNFVIERNCKEYIFNGDDSEKWIKAYQNFNNYYVISSPFNQPIKDSWQDSSFLMSDKIPSVSSNIYAESEFKKYNFGISTDNNNRLMFGVPKYVFSDIEGAKSYLEQNPLTVIVPLKTPTYEELPDEINKILLTGYENGTLFLDTNIPPTVTTTYSADVPLITSTAMSKAKVQSNTQDINDIVVPYMLDMDYRMVCLQLNTEPVEGDEVSMMAIGRMFGETFNMLKRDILSERLSKEEYKYRIGDYLKANKITKEQAEELEGLINE